MDQQGFLNHLKFECLHKLQLKNPHTGEIVLVPCGSCPACLLKRSYSNEIKAKVASTTTRFCYFVSLSYDVYNCPSYRITPVFREDGTVLCKCEDTRHRKEFLRNKHPKCYKGFSLQDIEPFEFVCDRDYYNRFTSQANLAVRRGFFDKRFDGEYSYLCRRDLQLFMKRFRKNLFDKIGYYAKIHTYFVGEYGIEHFRAHFHLLLLFDETEVAENVGYAINKSWLFGRVDFSADKGDAISYVASYVNCYTFLPLHLRETPGIRPFGRFSNGFGNSAFTSSIEQAKHGVATDFFNGKIFHFGSKPVSVRPFSRIESSCFFDAAKYRGANVSSLLTLLYASFKFFKLPFFKGVRRKVFSYCSAVVNNLDFIKRLILNSSHWFDKEHSFSYLLNYIGYSQGCYIELITSKGREIFQSRLYRFFSNVERFLQTYGLSLWDLHFNEKALYLPLLNSKSYYDAKSYYCYSNYCQNRNRYPGGLGSYFWRVTEVTQQEFRSSSVGRLLVKFQRNELLNRVKHRELNEKNRFFVSS